MNFNLLSQNLLLILCILVTADAVYLLTKLFIAKGKTKKDRRVQQNNNRQLLKELVIVIVTSALLAFLLRIFIAHETDSPIPRTFLLMVLPALFSLGLMVLVIRKKSKLWIIGAVGLIGSTFFSLLLINSYYRFYPTLGSVFNKNSYVLSLVPGGTNKTVELQFNPLSHVALDSQSIEGSLTSLANKSTNGKVFSINIPGTISKFHARTAYVYVPAIYQNPSQINLPVIILLPGFPGLTENWLGSGLLVTMDEFAKHHSGITPLVFMVDDAGSVTNDTECVDSSRGNIETYLTVDVPNYIKNNFNVITGPNHWAIGGLSMGGMCAAMLTLRHPQIYNYFLDYGGEIGPEIGSQQKTIQTLFNGSQKSWAEHQPNLLLTSHTYKGLGGFFGVGSQDERVVTQATNQLSIEAKQADIETIYEIVNGQHTFAVWQDAFKLSLPWVSNRIGATECGVACL